MRTCAIFVTPDDFMNYYGIDLDAELKDNDTPVDSNKANNFLMRVEDDFLNWCDANMGTRIYGKWEDVSSNKDIFESVQKAVIKQAFWVFRNGETMSDSGYDPQRGELMAMGTLATRYVSPAAIDIMKNSGLFTHKMQNRRRYGNWY